MHYRLMKRAISTVLITAFITFDIAWSYPDALQVPLRSTQDTFKAASAARYLALKADEIAAVIAAAAPGSLEDVLLFRESSHTAFGGVTVEDVRNAAGALAAVRFRLSDEAWLHYTWTDAGLSRELVFGPSVAAELSRQGAVSRSSESAEDRAALMRTIANVFRDGEGLDLSVDEIERAVIVDTTDDPYRIAKGLPVVIALSGEIFTTIKLPRKPLMIVFCGKGTVTDANLIFDPRSKGLATEGCNLANSMEVKNAIWEIPYHGKKTTFIAQDKDNWVAMPVLYGPQDIYDAGDLMGKGGDRISRLGPEIRKESGKADEDALFEEYSRAMVVARLLGFSILDGPDMMRDVDNRMGIMVRAVRETVRDINAAAAADPRIRPIDEREVLKPTTSNPESEGGFSHTKWMVTSSGVVQGTVTALRWLTEVARHPGAFLPEAVSFVRQLGLDIDRVSCIIQGFGDVGSGIAKLLLTTYMKCGISIRGISNRYFALYNAAGISTEFLAAARAIAEDNPDALDIERVLAMGDDLLGALAGSTMWVANPADPKSGTRRYDVQSVARYTARFASLGVTAVFGDPSIVDEVVYQDATILFPAAGPNLISDPAQIARLKAKIIAEGANNAIMRDLQPQLFKAGILYLPGELMNGGGIYTSKEDIRHNQTDGLHAILSDPEYYHIHVTDEIDTLVLHRMLRFLEIWSASESSFAVDIISHVRDAAGKIFQNADDLIRRRDPLLIEMVQIDQERTGGKLPRRHSLYEIAIEMAPQGILYREGEAQERLAEFESLLGTIRSVREDASLGNFTICRVRYALFVLTKMRDALSEDERARLARSLFSVVADVRVDDLVRKEAIICLASLIKWRGTSGQHELSKAIRLFRGIADSEDKDTRLNVWSRYALYRILGVENLEGEAADAFERIASVCRAELAAVRAAALAGDAAAIPGSIEAISDALRLMTSDRALSPLRRLIDDSMHDYARIPFLAKALPVTRPQILDAIDSALLGLDKLDAARRESRLMAAAEAHQAKLWSISGFTLLETMLAVGIVSALAVLFRAVPPVMGFAAMAAGATVWCVIALGILERSPAEALAELRDCFRQGRADSLRMEGGGLPQRFRFEESKLWQLRFGAEDVEQVPVSALEPGDIFQFHDEGTVSEFYPWKYLAEPRRYVSVEIAGAFALEYVERDLLSRSTGHALRLVPRRFRDTASAPLPDDPVSLVKGRWIGAVYVQDAGSGYLRATRFKRVGDPADALKREAKMMATLIDAGFDVPVLTLAADARLDFLKGFGVRVRAALRGIDRPYYTIQYTAPRGYFVYPEHARTEAETRLLAMGSARQIGRLLRERFFHNSLALTAGPVWIWDEERPASILGLSFRLAGSNVRQSGVAGLEHVEPLSDDVDERSVIGQMLSEWTLAITYHASAAGIPPRSIHEIMRAALTEGAKEYGVALRFTEEMVNALDMYLMLLPRAVATDKLPSARDGGVPAADNLVSFIGMVTDEMLRGKAPATGGRIQQGTKSADAFEAAIDQYRQRDVTTEYNRRVVTVVERFLGNAALSPRQRFAVQSRLKKFKRGQVRIYSMSTLVRGADDFYFDNFDVRENELFIPTGFLMDLSLRGEAELVDEFLLHAVLCASVGHYPAIALQQAAYPAHYARGEYETVDGIRYLPGHAGDRIKVFKGLLGERLRAAISELSSDRDGGENGVRPHIDARIDTVLESSLRYAASASLAPADLVPSGARILLSEELFDAQTRARLGLALKANERLTVVPAREAHNVAINAKNTKDKVIVVLTESEFNDTRIWSASDKETRVNASILILKDRLEDADYLYLESVVKLACAVLRQDKAAVAAYYKLITGGEISRSALDALGASAIAFAINAILRFDHLSVKDGEELERYERAMETFLAAA